MAQIKKIVKPGDLIRGASVGLAGIDKDGNVIAAGIAAKDIATWPEGAQSGDVLTWGGETGPEWRPHYPESGSEGDVLTMGETGPEWAPPAGGGNLFAHYVVFTDANVKFSVLIITTSDATFTAATLANWLTDNGFLTGTTKKLPVTCGSSIAGSNPSMASAQYDTASNKIGLWAVWDGSNQYSTTMADAAIHDNVASIA